MLINIIGSNNTAQDKFLIIVAFMISAMFAITFHEVSHGYVAKLNGDDTAKMMGRLTFNPVKHFDLLGFLMFIVVGFGWAKPVPINPNNFKNYKKGVITVSLAGVFANLIACFVNFGLLACMMAIAANTAIDSAVGMVFYKFFTFLFLYGTIINISLIAFNILPIYPLDGFNVLAMLTKPNNKAVAFLRQYGYGILIILLLVGTIFPAFDFIGMYFGAVQNAILGLFSKLFGGIII